VISLLSGTIQSTLPHGIVLLTAGGVGYDVAMTKSHLARLSVGNELTFFTYMRVSENELSLFGFEGAAERDFFELLLSVKGVGPKSAMNILSLGSLDDIQSAIARGDAVYLSTVQGMGKKTAERLCVELKSKVNTLGTPTSSGGGAHGSMLSDVIDGLMSLGYSREEAKQRVQSMNISEEHTVEVLVKRALRQ
jgi:holliday junction DNA helicase RuvA